MSTRQQGVTTVTASAVVVLAHSPLLSGESGKTEDEPPAQRDSDDTTSAQLRP